MRRDIAWDPTLPEERRAVIPPYTDERELQAYEDWDVKWGGRPLWRDFVGPIARPLQLPQLGGYRPSVPDECKLDADEQEIWGTSGADPDTMRYGSEPQPGAADAVARTPTRLERQQGSVVPEADPDVDAKKVGAAAIGAEWARTGPNVNCISPGYIGPE